MQTTIKIEVPAEYVGWCYLIPASDTAGFVSKVTDGKYQADSNGVVYVPVTEFDIKKDNVIKLYDNNVDISNAMRYAGSIYKLDIDKRKYNYVTFYLPSAKERNIPDGKEYWRTKRHHYSQPNIKKFDSLFAQGIIVFK